MIRTCSQCGARNRIPARHLADTGRCGVRSIPNFAVFSGGSLVWQQAGLMRHPQLERAVLQQA